MEEDNKNIENSENRETQTHENEHSQQSSNEISNDKGETWFLRTRNIIYYILGIIEILLIFRLVFRSLGANATNAIVSFLYGVTYALIVPFIGIFKAIMPSGTVQYVIEPATIIAMVVYALIAYGIVRLIKVTAVSV